MRRIAAIIVAMALLLSGCGDRRYVDITPHIESNVTPNSGGDLTASNYAELKSAILYLVEQSDEEGTISLVGYSGQVEEDLRAACAEVTNNEPIGAYGVEYMSYTCMKVLANYEASVSISYSRSPEEMAAVRRINGADEYRAEIEQTVRSLERELVVETPYYSAERFDALVILGQVLEKNPLMSVATPSVEQTLYPSEGLQRIVELRIDYGAEEDDLNSRLELLEQAAREMVLADAPGEESDVDKVLRLVSALCRTSEFVPEREDDLGGEVARDETFTAYGALVEGTATSEGFAYALSALCSLGALDCKIVRGRWDDITHYWNLVRVDGSWYHVDAALTRLYGTGDYLLKTDSEMGEALKWNTQSYPTAAGEVITFAADGIDIPVSEQVG